MIMRLLARKSYFKRKFIYSRGLIRLVELKKLGFDFFLIRQIIDDGFEHSLAVIQDKKSFGLRLHAAVWNGELRKCPVWTAFGMFLFSYKHISSYHCHLQ
jgi:hypothetical protein